MVKELKPRKTTFRMTDAEYKLLYRAAEGSTMQGVLETALGNLLPGFRSGAKDTHHGDTNSHDHPDAPSPDLISPTKLKRAAELAAELNGLLNGEMGELDKQGDTNPEIFDPRVRRAIAGLEEARRSSSSSVDRSQRDQSGDIKAVSGRKRK